jgi:hypothetical protein
MTTAAAVVPDVVGPHPRQELVVLQHVDEQHEQFMAAAAAVPRPPTFP